MHLPKLLKKSHGFTLVEIMVAISILAVVSAVGLISYNQSQKLARDSKRKQDLRTIAVALELYYQNNRRYPCGGISWMNSGSANWLSDLASCTGAATSIAPAYINAIPKDPLSNGNPLTNGTYGYAYYSINAAAGTCPQGSYYILATQLENTNDPDRLSSKNIPFCGGTIAPGSSIGGTYLNHNYVLAAP